MKRGFARRCAPHGIYTVAASYIRRSCFETEEEEEHEENDSRKKGKSIISEIFTKLDLKIIR